MIYCTKTWWSLLHNQRVIEAVPTRWETTFDGLAGIWCTGICWRGFIVHRLKPGNHPIYFWARSSSTKMFIFERQARLPKSHLQFQSACVLICIVCLCMCFYCCLVRSGHPWSFFACRVPEKIETWILIKLYLRNWLIVRVNSGKWYTATSMDG